MGVTGQYQIERSFQESFQQFTRIDHVFIFFDLRTARVWDQVVVKNGDPDRPYIVIQWNFPDFSQLLWANQSNIYISLNFI